MGHVCRRGLSDGRAEGCIVFIPPRAGGDDDRYRIRIIRVGKLHTLADAGYGARDPIQPTPLRRGMVDRRIVPGVRGTGVVILDPPIVPDVDVKCWDVQ